MFAREQGSERFANVRKSVRTNVRNPLQAGVDRDCQAPRAHARVRSRWKRALRPEFEALAHAAIAGLPHTRPSTSRRVRAAVTRSRGVSNNSAQRDDFAQPRALRV